MSKLFLPAIVGMTSLVFLFTGFGKESGTKVTTYGDSNKSYVHVKTVDDEFSKELEYNNRTNRYWGN